MSEDITEIYAGDPIPVTIDRLYAINAAVSADPETDLTSWNFFATLKDSLADLDADATATLEPGDFSKLAGVASGIMRTDGLTLTLGRLYYFDVLAVDPNGEQGTLEFRVFKFKQRGTRRSS